MPKIIFVQYSDQLLSEDRQLRNYYAVNYKRMPGYHFPDHFFEIPYWIAVLSGMLNKSAYVEELHISTDNTATINMMRNEAIETVFCFSAMDANLAQILEVCQNVPDHHILIGGYVSPNHFDVFSNAQYLRGMPEISKNLQLAPKKQYPLDYSLFSGLKCIPRLTLSTGCLFRCNFCANIPLKVVPITASVINQSVDSLKPLDFELIYVDDKSFGQSPNYRYIGQVRDRVRQFNANFLGFTVQTTASIAAKPGFLEEIRRFGVQYLEFGLETGNDNLLRLLNKPFRIKHADATAKECRRLGIGLIPNVIIGIPGDDYSQTIAWVEKNRDIIPAVNIYYFAAHSNTERGAPIVDGKSMDDADENKLSKSWLDANQLKAAKNAVWTLQQITSASSDDQWKCKISQIRP